MILVFFFQVKNQNPELKFVEIGKIVGGMWKQLSEDDKSEFVEEYELEKTEYDKKMAAYKNTPAYQVAAVGLLFN